MTWLSLAFSFMRIRLNCSEFYCTLLGHSLVMRSRVVSYILCSFYRLILTWLYWCVLELHYVFTARLRLSVSLSVISRRSTKTAKSRITQTTPHDNPGTVVFWCQRSPRNSTRITPCGGAKCRWSGPKSATFDNYSWLYLENGTR